MPSLDLYSHSPNPTPEQLMTVCDEFMKMVGYPSALHSKQLLQVAQNLCEQILGHYGSLSEVAEELAGFSGHGEKLPHQAFYVFFYTSVQNHPSLGIVLDEMTQMYGDGEDKRACNSIRGMWQDGLISFLPKPRLWDADGKLQCRPGAFAFMQRDAFARQVGDFYHQGAQGVQKILDDYPLMDEESRLRMDAELCSIVYTSVTPANDPRRVLLKDKLVGMQDGLTRFEKLFEHLDNPDDHLGFDARLNHAFDLVGALPAEEGANLVERAINRCIRNWKTDHGDGMNSFNEPVVAVPNLVMVLERARQHGFNPLGEVARNIRYMANQNVNKSMVESLLDEGFLEDRSELDTATAWQEAALIATDEKIYLDLGLDEKYLVMLLKIKGTPGLREALKHTSAGREAVFSHDLGL